MPPQDEGGAERRHLGVRHPRVGHPLTDLGGHRLHTMGSRLDLECVPMVPSIQNWSLDELLCVPWPEYAFRFSLIVHFLVYFIVVS